MSPRPLDEKLYARAKKMANKIYDRPSAYKSGYIVKTYKKMGGTYADNNRGGKSKKSSLSRWFREKWTDVNPNKTNNSYPVYRPTVRISENTPLTADEINEKDLIEKAKVKQRYGANIKLAPFKKKKKHHADNSAYKLVVYV